MREEFSQVLVRMPASLKQRLAKAAFVNNRKVTQEINLRLESSFAANEPYALPPLVTRVIASDQTAVDASGGPLSNTDQVMLAVFRALPAEKQLALLSLFR